jgi:hypothetical protein
MKEEEERTQNKEGEPKEKGHSFYDIAACALFRKLSQQTL